MPIVKNIIGFIRNNFTLISILLIFFMAYCWTVFAYKFGLTFHEDAWFWFFSTIAQTFAALIALIAIFLIFRLDSYNLKIKFNYKLIRVLVEDIFPGSSSPYYLATDDVLENDSDTIRLKLGVNESIRWDHLWAEIYILRELKKEMILKFVPSFSYIFQIIVISIILLPLGYLDIGNNNVIDFWNTYKVKWFLIYSIVGFSIVALYSIIFNLADFFKDG